MMIPGRRVAPSVRRPPKLRADACPSVQCARAPAPLFPARCFQPGRSRPKLRAKRLGGERRMARQGKQVGSFAAAVADIPDGSVIAFGGFAGPGTPYNLTKALLDRGAKRLTCIGNTTGGAHQPRLPDIGML